MSLIQQVKEINAEISEFNKSQQEALAYARVAKENLENDLKNLKDTYGIELPSIDSPDFEEKLKDIYTRIKEDLEQQVELSKKVLDLADEGEFGKARELLGISNNLESETDTVEVENTTELDESESQTTEEEVVEVAEVAKAKHGKGVHHVIEDDALDELDDDALAEALEPTKPSEEQVEPTFARRRNRFVGDEPEEPKHHEEPTLSGVSNLDEDFSIPTRRSRSSFTTEGTKETSVTLDDITKAVKSEPKEEAVSDAPIVRKRKRQMDPDWFK